MPKYQKNYLVFKMFNIAQYYDFGRDLIFIIFYYDDIYNV